MKPDQKVSCICKYSRYKEKLRQDVWTGAIPDKVLLETEGGTTSIIMFAQE